MGCEAVRGRCLAHREWAERGGGVRGDGWALRGGEADPPAVTENRGPSHAVQRQNRPAAGHKETDVQTERQRRFEALAAEVFGPLQRYLLRRMTPEDAADAFSETLLVIWRRLEDVPSENPLPWCYGVARRVASNHRRGRRRHLQLVERLEREPAPAPQEESGDPELEAALARLTDSDREILRLWAWEGLEPREIATVLGLTVNAATLRLSRARRKLGEEMTRQDPRSSGQERVGRTKEQTT